MSIIIPLHSVVLSEFADPWTTFAAHERLSLASITDQLIGQERSLDVRTGAFAELRHRVSLKLGLGERVAIFSEGLNNDHRRQLTALALGQGARAFTIGHASCAMGAEVISPTAVLAPIPALPQDLETHLRSRWQGITVIGDVHGECAKLLEALAWARARQHFVCLLGDVVDYGKQSLETADAVYHAVMGGEATMVVANHERKIARWLNRDGQHLRLSEGNRVTISALERLTARDRARWIGRFRALLSHTALSIQIGDVALMHAAAHPTLWGEPDLRAIEQLAIYGEADQQNGQYRRTHRWVDSVPPEKLVIVGHEIVSNYPMVCSGTTGGKVVFLDTGCGKGGVLSSADLRFTPTGLKLECFKRH